MISYTYKKGICQVCGQEYFGLICDEEPDRNICKEHIDGTLAVENARTLRYFACQPYYDTGLGCHINSRGERAAIMKQNDLVCMGDDYKHLDDIPLGEKFKGTDPDDDEWGQLWHDEVESK